MNQIILRQRSRKLMLNTHVGILLPEPGMGKRPEDYYVNGKKYPVLWLLHGATGDIEDFIYRTHLEQMLRGKEVMVVIPNGLNSDFANHMEFGTGFPFTDYLFEELMPYVYQMFPASQKPEDNYLAGYSMGGAAALMLGLYRPEKFGQVGVLGSTIRESEFLRPYLDYSGEEFRKEAMADRRKFPTEFGDPAYGITLKEINMISRYPTVRDYVDSMECTIERFDDAAKAGKLPSLYFCCGDQDSCCEKVKEFRKHAEKLGVTDIGYEFVPGYGHDRMDVTLERCFARFRF
ncbi:MAG: esterase family protein [Lachnospiraceae bacterium]|nr:esterase family protein [Lachnospiraceae bacterium]